MVFASRTTGGAKYVYKLCIVPTFDVYRQSIDDTLDRSRETVKHGIRRAAATAMATTAATGTFGFSTVKWGLLASGSGVGSMVQFAAEAVRSRRSSSAFDLKV